MHPDVVQCHKCVSLEWNQGKKRGNHNILLSWQQQHTERSRASIDLSRFSNNLLYDNIKLHTRLHSLLYSFSALELAVYLRSVPCFIGSQTFQMHVSPSPQMFFFIGGLRLWFSFFLRPCSPLDIQQSSCSFQNQLLVPSKTSIQIARKEIS